MGQFLAEAPSVPVEHYLDGATQLTALLNQQASITPTFKVGSGQVTNPLSSLQGIAKISNTPVNTLTET